MRYLFVRIKCDTICRRIPIIVPGIQNNSKKKLVANIVADVWNHDPKRIVTNIP